MKKISCLCLLVLLLFGGILRISAESIKLDDFQVKIEGINKTSINLSFTTTTPIKITQIDIISDLDGGTSEVIYSDDRQNEKVKKVVDGELIEDKYVFNYIMESQSGKIGTFQIRIKVYNYLDNSLSQHYVYVSNGNVNIGRSVFTIGNALKIGAVATVGGALATFVLIKLSEKNVQVLDEEEND